MAAGRGHERLHYSDVAARRGDQRAGPSPSASSASAPGTFRCSFLFLSACRAVPGVRGAPVDWCCCPAEAGWAAAWSSRAGPMSPLLHAPSQRNPSSS